MTIAPDTLELLLVSAFVAGLITADLTAWLTRWALRKAKGVRRG